MPFPKSTRPVTRQAEKVRQIVRFSRAQNAVAGAVTQWHYTPIDVFLSAMHEGLAKEKLDKPWEGLGRVMLPNGRFTSQQFAAAVEAAPYIHPKLQAIAYREQPDEAREKRRNLLAKIPYEQRRQIAQMLQAAQQRSDDEMGAVVESVASEGAEESGK